MASATPNSSESIEGDNSGPLVALSIAFIPIATIFTALRFFARHLSEAPFGLDDVLALVSWALSLTVSILSICFVHYGGVGHHFAYWEVTDPSKIVTYFKYLFAVSTCYYLPVTVPKLSILAFYSRIFAVQPYRVAIQVLAAVLIATAVVNIIVSFIICRPLPYYWDRTIPGGQCYDLIAYYTWAGFPNIVTDLAMIVLPIHSVWKLHTSTSVKMGLTGVFATGGLGLVGSVVRFILFRSNAITDGTWHSTQLMLWGSVECYCYLLVACMVAFRPLISLVVRGSRKRSAVTVNGQTSRKFSHHKTPKTSSQTEFPGSAMRLLRLDEDRGSEATDTTKTDVLVTVERGGSAQNENLERPPERIYAS